jgi:hypothetical protein
MSVIAGAAAALLLLLLLSPVSASTPFHFPFTSLSLHFPSLSQRSLSRLFSSATNGLTARTIGFPSFSLLRFSDGVSTRLIITYWIVGW